jgi:hypothetical protein
VVKKNPGRDPLCGLCELCERMPSLFACFASFVVLENCGEKSLLTEIAASPALLAMTGSFSWTPL